MFKNRSFNSLVGLTIAVLAVLSIGTVISTPQVVSGIQDNRLAPLDWYFSHDHAILDGDNNAVSGVNIPVNERYSALKDKQLELLDAVVSAVTASVAPTSAERYITLKDKQLGRLDAVAPAVLASVAPTSFERYMKLKDLQLQRLDSAGFANPN